MREMLFLSHANPEDNEFARWLALQLAREGYPVWCDMTQLLGGEDFWRDIEQAIRQRTVKFLYVLSTTSNSKPGPRRELDLALGVARKDGLQDFIIPLQVESLPHDEVNILIHGITSVPFNAGWATGLKILLEKLERDRVPKKDNFNPSAVSVWWRQQFSADEGVRNEPEDYLSNWFPVNALPEHIFFHTLYGTLELPSQLPYPAFRQNQFLVSFAYAEDFEGKLGESLSIHDSFSFPVLDLLEKHKVEEKFGSTEDGRNSVYRLLRMAWERNAGAKGLVPYELANRNLCLYFPKDLVESDRIYFEGMNGGRSYRWVVGHSKRWNRYWHFGIQAKPIVYPALGYVIKSHVLFSDDGNTIWESKSRLHKARRSQCKNWWNSEWRDRILATMFWLANGDGKIQIDLGSNVTIEVSQYPMRFSSPVTYADPSKLRSSVDRGEKEALDEESDETDDLTDYADEQ